jgi:hypothetical protein
LEKLDQIRIGLVLIVSRTLGAAANVRSAHPVQATSRDVTATISITLTKTGLKGIFGIGRVEFSSAAGDDAEVVFWDVGGAEGVRDRVRSLQTREEVGNKE